MLATAEAIEIDWIVDLINEYSDLTRHTANEDDQPYPQLHAHPHAPDVAAGLHSAAMVEAANQLLAVFMASPDPHAVAEQLNHLLADGQPRIAAVADNGVERGYVIDRARSPLVTASALALLDFVEAQGVERLGCCAANNCTDVFVDHSQAHNKTYCSQTCQTRERVARYRKNHP